jgi:hypothetical protein
MVYCRIQSNQIVDYINPGEPFGLSEAGLRLYRNRLPDDVLGTNYPADWLTKASQEWRELHGLLELVVTGNTEQNKFYTTSYEDSVLNGIPTRTYTRTAKPVAECRDILKSEVANLRWQKSIGSFTFSGVTVKLDDETKSNVSQAIQLFDKDPNLTAIDWKFGNTFFTFDKTTMNALGVAMGNYTQQLFTANKTHAETIDGLTAAQCRNYDISTGWPANEV